LFVGGFMESFKTTAESYAKREAVAGAQQKRALTVLTGGKLASGGGDLLNTSEKRLQSFPKPTFNRD
jgi:hypothetical protein